MRDMNTEKENKPPVSGATRMMTVSDSTETIRERGEQVVSCSKDVCIIGVDIQDRRDRREIPNLMSQQEIVLLLQYIMKPSHTYIFAILEMSNQRKIVIIFRIASDVFNTHLTKWVALRQDINYPPQLRLRFNPMLTVEHGSMFCLLTLSSLSPPIPAAVCSDEGSLSFSRERYRSTPITTHLVLHTRLSSTNCRSCLKASKQPKSICGEIS